jgi:type IX secretion system substrate protein
LITSKLRIMRKIYAFILSFAITASVFAVDVTFTVNMSNETVSANGVHVAGGFDANGSSGIAWDPAAYKLTDQGNGYFTFTLKLNPGKYEFKFINDNAWGGAENVPLGAQVGGGNSNRWVYVDTNATFSVDTVCFGRMADCGKIGVLLNVSMATQTVSSNGVHIAGSLQGWDPGKTMLYNPDGGPVYKYIYQADTGESIEFKFVNGNAWGDDESVPGACAQNGNRFINSIQADTLYPEVCYAACDPCATVTVTFQVDMSNEVVSADGIHVAGSFQGWDPGKTALTDIGNGLYEVKLDIQMQAHEFKFVNGNSWGNEETVPAACISNGNRSITANVDTLYKVCFSSCTWPCVSFPDTSNVTFKVIIPDTINISSDPDSGGVWIMASFTSPSWQSGAIQMTDLGNKMYETTVTLGGVPELQYKFVLNKPNTTGSIDENGDFLSMGCGVSNPVSTPNRLLVRTDNDTTVTYCWNTCSDVCIVGIGDPLTESNGVSIYPNPFSGTTRVEFQNPGDYTLRLMDITGRLLGEFNVLSGSYYDLDAGDLQKGIYLLQVYDGEQIQGVYKLVLE